jgi:hypothetical protein
LTKPIRAKVIRVDWRSLGQVSVNFFNECHVLLLVWRYLSLIVMLALQQAASILLLRKHHLHFLHLNIY